MEWHLFQQISSNSRISRLSRSVLWIWINVSNSRHQCLNIYFGSWKWAWNIRRFSEEFLEDSSVSVLLIVFETGDFELANRSDLMSSSICSSFFHPPLGIIKNKSTSFTDFQRSECFGVSLDPSLSRVAEFLSSFWVSFQKTLPWKIPILLLFLQIWRSWSLTSLASSSACFREVVLLRRRHSWRSRSSFYVIWSIAWCFKHICNRIHFNWCSFFIVLWIEIHLCSSKNTF